MRHVCLAKGALRPVFQHRHYEAIAKLIAHAKRRPNDSVEEALADLQRDLADLFREDNAKFSTIRFFQACEPAEARA